MILLREEQKLQENHIDYISIVIVASRGSSPSEVGAKALVTKEGLHFGTVGGGKVEAKAIENAKGMLKKLIKHDFVTWNLQKDVGMTCGGEVSFYFEAHYSTKWPIAIFGAGHVAQALVPLLCQLGAQVFCIDKRSEWLDRLEDQPNLKKICLAEAKNFVAELPEGSSFLLMSQGHSTDLPVLHAILDRPMTHRYLGVIGSPAKKLVLQKELRELGVTDERLDAFHCPIGLPLGKSIPIEIAVSVAAQMLQIRDEPIEPALSIFTSGH